MLAEQDELQERENARILERDRHLIDRREPSFTLISQPTFLTYQWQRRQDAACQQEHDQDTRGCGCSE